VSLLGHGDVSWRQTAKGLEIRLPEAPADDMPYVLKITFRD
jgi:hypothetical protein